MSSPTGGFGHNTSSLEGYAPLIGVLPTPIKAVIYTVPAGKNTAIASIEAFNGTAGAVVITWYINVSGSDSGFGGGSVAPLTGFSDTLPRNLPQGAIISGVSDTAGVTYLIQLKEYVP